MLYDGDGCTSVSLAALGVLGNTTDEAMQTMYDCADCDFVTDSQKAREERKRAELALVYNPLRGPVAFKTHKIGEFLHMRPLEVSPEDVARALDSVHGPGGFTWTRHTGKTQWWKDTRGKYIVTGELNSSTVLPEGNMDWIDLNLGVDADNASKHVIAVSGGKFFCKNIKKWLPTKYLWLGKSGKPMKHRKGGVVVVKGLLKTIDCVYKVDVHHN